MYYGYFDSTTTNCVAFIALVGWAPLLFLLTATDGASVHGFGLLGGVRSGRRWFALIASNIILGGMIGTMYITQGVTPIDLWHGAGIWWKSPTGIFGKTIAVLAWWVLLSPVQSLIACVRIVRASSREGVYEY